MFYFSAHTTFYQQFHDQKVLTHQYQNNANDFFIKQINHHIMFKWIHNISNKDLTLNPIDIKKKPEEEKEKQDTNSKDYETIRKLVKGTNKPMKKT